ncbi:MAG TPA: PD-(D/E)XK nuclease family protein [Acidobacteriaceae bacterium]|jgi:probable DNA repair protein|nr:PD-(D/E)XK nuclease family protein [Acidobacteriaceae bacterium]
MHLPGPIADALRRGATIVAASPRTTRALHLRFAESQRAAGIRVWPSPAIVDWDSWLRGLFRDYAFSVPNAPMLLSPLQEQALWTRVQREDAALVLAPEAMAALAAEAWSLLSTYTAHGTRRQAWEQTDAERFRHWAAEFDRECARNRWLSAAQLAGFLTAEAEHLTLPPEIVLIGFDRMPPAHRDFLGALERFKVTVIEFRPEPDFPPATAARSWRAAPDQRSEIDACAVWAREFLLAHPDARIGVLVPGLAALRNPIDRAFRRILMPGSEDLREPSAVMPWEFSLGQPLAEVPVIRAALLLLRWIAAPLREEEISWLVLSGFVADTATQSRALARHDARQRNADLGLLTPERSLASYRASLTSAPGLRGLWTALGAIQQAAVANQILDTSRQPSALADLAQQGLEAGGWPGDRSPDSVQYQALERWQRLLDEVALLDFDGTRSSWIDFVALLERTARETIFAPESHDAPIQIMGPFESSGQQFDALWFLSTNEAAWPQRGRFHPLLPAAVQRQFDMPHNTPADDWNLAAIVTARLLASAPTIVFSYAERDKEADLRPSPLIAGLFPDQVRADPAALPSSAPENLPTEPVPDAESLPWPVEQNAGGATVLKAQAACPFQAFARRRLGAEPLDIAEKGLPPADKGRILHEILQSLFGGSPVPGTSSEGSPVLATLRTRDDIVTVIDTEQIPALLDAHIDAVFRLRFAAAPDHPWQSAYLAAEKRRLHARLTEWLACEARRQPFTVEAREQRLPDVHIGDLRLNLRADRIDLLPDGSRLLLDYKTGRISPAAWKGDRPDEPQLPLYAACGHVENLSGVLFAKIRAGSTNKKRNTGFEGRVRDAHAQLSADFGDKEVIVTDPYSDEMRDEWARALEDLALEFLHGVATVTPRGPQVCKQCALPALCRKAELDLASAAEDDEETADA